MCKRQIKNNKVNSHNEEEEKEEKETENELVCEEIADDDTSQNRKYLSTDMFKMAKKFPTVLKDNLKNCHAFRDQPSKVIDIDPSIEPFYETRIMMRMIV